LEDLQVHLTLQGAAEDAKVAYEYNKDKQPSFRASRAGIPLVQLVLEGLVFPSLPRLVPSQQTEAHQRKRRFKSKMAIAVGHLYSKAIGESLVEEHPDCLIHSEVPLTYGDIAGNCDHLVLDHQQKTATVVECKALGGKTITEIKETKLLTDAWGYHTQLALYVTAVSKDYPDYQVEGQWRVWCKPMETSYTVKFTGDMTRLLKAAVSRSASYFEATMLYQEKRYTELAELLTTSLEYDPLPLKGFLYGNRSASCAIHFNPWTAALFDDDGIPFDDFRERLHILLLSDPKKSLAILDKTEADCYS